MRTRLARLASIVIVLSLFVAARADAGTFTFKKAQVTVAVPDKWSTADEGDYVTFATKDQNLAINLAWGGNDVDAAWDLLIQQVQGVVSGFTADKKAGVLSNMKGYVGSGKGTLSGTKVECLVAVLATPGGAMTIFAVGAVGKYEKYEDEMTSLLNGIAAIGGAPAGAIVQDDDWAQVPADGQKWALKVVVAIDKNDQKAFLKVVSKKGLSAFDGENTTVVKSSKLKKAIKKAGSVAAFLGFPNTGEWHVRFDAETGGFSFYRGDGSSVVLYLAASKVKKKWQLDGTYMEDHGAPE